MTKETCDLCNGQLRPIYKPDGTKRGLTVCVCGGCGLLQSLPRTDTVEDKTPSISYRADTGNVRVGKGHRAKANLGFIKSVMPHVPRRVLDVGAGRGDFAKELYKSNPVLSVFVYGIEPDLSIIDHNLPVSYFEGRVEKANLDGGFEYDLIHLSHTLEHLKSPLATLKRLHGALADDGYLFVEVPNILGIIKVPDIFEEVFIDKHLYHFYNSPFWQMLSMAGFEIVKDYNTAENLGAICTRGKPHESFGVYGGLPADRVGELLNAYDMNRQGNLQEIAAVASELNQKAREFHLTGCYNIGGKEFDFSSSPLNGQSSFIYGVGRLFDALRQNGLDTSLFTLVDKYLDRSLFPELNIIRPNELAPDENFVFIASRSGYKEMAAEAKELCPGAVVWGMGDF